MDSAKRLLAQINDDFKLNSLRSNIKSILLEGCTARDILSDIKHQLLLSGKHKEVAVLREAIKRLDTIGIREDL